MDMTLLFERGEHLPLDSILLLINEGKINTTDPNNSPAQFAPAGNKLGVRISLDDLNVKLQLEPREASRDYRLYVTFGWGQVEQLFCC